MQQFYLHLMRESGILTLKHKVSFINCCRDAWIGDWDMYYKRIQYSPIKKSIINSRAWWFAGRTCGRIASRKCAFPRCDSRRDPRLKWDMVGIRYRLVNSSDGNTVELEPILRRFFVISYNRAGMHASIELIGYGKF